MEHLGIIARGMAQHDDAVAPRDPAGAGGGRTCAVVVGTGSRCVRSMSGEVAVEALFTAPVRAAHDLATDRGGALLAPGEVIEERRTRVERLELRTAAAGDELRRTASGVPGAAFAAKLSVPKVRWWRPKAIGNRSAGAPCQAGPCRRRVMAPISPIPASSSA